MIELEQFCKNHNIKFTTKTVSNIFHFMAEFSDGYILRRSSIMRNDADELLKDLKCYLSMNAQLL